MVGRSHEHMAMVLLPCDEALAPKAAKPFRPLGQAMKVEEKNVRCGELGASEFCIDLRGGLCL